MDAETVHVNVWKRAQIINAFHLILHLNLAELVEGSLFEVTSTVLTATIVDDEDNVAFLSHICLPRTTGPMPRGLHVVGVRTAIDINHCGVFLFRIEISGLHHPIK